MTFVAKYAPPTLPEVEYLPRVLASAVEGHTSLFNVAPGSLLTSQIAAALRHRGAPSMWLRLGREDADPGVLLTSLMTAANRLNPAVIPPVIQEMLRKPGPVNGWAPLFTLLAQVMQSVLPAYSALVIEHLQNLPAGSDALDLLGAYFLPLLPGDFVCILTTHHPLQPGVLPRSVVVHQTGELRIDQNSVLAQSRVLNVAIPDRDILRLHSLSEGRPELMMSLLRLAASVDLAVLRKAVDQARSPNDFLARLARGWAATISPEVGENMLLAVRLGYLHPVLGQVGETPAWMQALDENWARIRCPWNAPLSSALQGQNPARQTLLRTADTLAQLGSADQAIPLYLEAGETYLAAEVLSDNVTEMINLGQWNTLSGWLNRIPQNDLLDFPWLVYARGELEAYQPDIRKASRTFSLSSRLFQEKGVPEGVCRSLLTESALAFWQGNHGQALDLALRAQAEARAAGLEQDQAYAAWQIGCLYAADELYSAALQQFQEVENLSRNLKDDPLGELSARAVMLVRLEQDLQQHGNSYRQALAAIEVTLQETINSLQQMISSPASNLTEFLSDRGWFRTPLNLKAQPVLLAPVEGEKLPGLWQSLLNLFGRGSSAEEPVTNGPAPVTLFHLPPIPVSGVETKAIPSSAIPPVLPEAGPSIEVIQPEELPAQTNPVPMREKTLTVKMLGLFEVKINEQPVTNWSSGRGRAIFQYLLINHLRPRSREALMDVFWQDSTPESARNNLNVALYNLRGSLRAVTIDPVVLFEDGSYRINPDFHLQLDTDAFERLAAEAQQADQSGDTAAAIAACENALRLYQDDFLSEFPFEEWAILPRERLKILHMDTLDRLSRIYLKEGEYAACARLCQMMLERDRCWEDAHTRLMRCYARQGIYDLAIRQYQACQDALREELNLEPSQDTEQLYQKIRRRESI